MRVGIFLATIALARDFTEADIVHIYKRGTVRKKLLFCVWFSKIFDNEIFSFLKLKKNLIFGI